MAKKERFNAIQRKYLRMKKPLSPNGESGEETPKFNKIQSKYLTGINASPAFSAEAIHESPAVSPVDGIGFEEADGERGLPTARQQIKKAPAVSPFAAMTSGGPREPDTAAFPA